MARPRFGARCVRSRPHPTRAAALLPLAGLISALLWASPARADLTVLLRDGFDAENGGNGMPSYAGFANFVATDVDLLGGSFYGSLCQAAGHAGSCIDMDGTHNGSLVTRAAYDLVAGMVTLKFDLSGDPRHTTTNQVTVSLLGTDNSVLYREAFSLGADVPFVTYTRTVSLAAPASVRLSFASTGIDDGWGAGMLLDNVELDGVAAVPEPATLALLGAGLVAVGLAPRRRRAAEGAGT